MISRMRAGLASWLLRLSESLSPDILKSAVNDRAGKLGTEVAMGYLDRERILHCSMCPSRQQLRRHGNWLACADHNDYILKAWEEKQARENGQVLMTTSNGSSSR